MFTAVSLGHFLPVSAILLHGRVDQEFFAHGMSGKFPGEQVLIAGLFVGILATGYYLVVGFEFAVVLLDCVRDSRAHVDRFD